MIDRSEKVALTTTTGATMKTVEYWRWMTWNLQHTKLTPTRHHMDEETALAQHPEAVRVPNSMQLREICETEEDLARQMIR